MYRIAKDNDFTKNNQIKDEQPVGSCMGRRKGYFDKLLNGENRRFVFEDGLPNDGLTHGIGRNEVSVTLSRMKKGETTDIDAAPEDVWMCLGEEGIDMLSI